MSRALILGLVVSLARLAPARAAEYGADVAVASRDELLALAAAGEIDAETLETLLQLSEAPIDLEHASEEAVAQLPGVSRAAALGLAEARLSDEGWMQLAPFVAGTTKAQHFEIAGAALRDTTTWSTGMLRARLHSGGFAGGVLATWRPRVHIRSSGDPVLSTGERNVLGLERFYGVYAGPRFSLVVGSFACAFGDGVTLSTARQLYASRLVAVDTVGTGLADAPLRPVPALRGLGVSAVLVSSSSVRVVATGLGSHRKVELYQYGEWVRGDASPAIVDASGEPVRYATIANAAREVLGAGALELESKAAQLAVNGYAAQMRLEDAQGALSPSSRYPVGGRYGALGARARLRLDPFTVRFEGARTLTGGLAGVGRVELLPTDWLELSMGLRYYGRDFDNPYTRSFAEPDEVEGARARDERGIDTQLALSPVEWLRITAWGDVWTRASTAAGRGVRLRGNVLLQPTDDETLTFESAWTNREVDACSEEPSCSVPTVNQQLTVAARVVTTRIPHVRLALSSRSTFAESPQGAPAALGSTLHRVMAHATVRVGSWLTLSLIASQRLTGRTRVLSDTERVLAATLVVKPSSLVRIEASARDTARGLAAGTRHEIAAMADMVVSL